MVRSLVDELQMLGSDVFAGEEEEVDLYHQVRKRSSQPNVSRAEHHLII